MLAKLDQKLDLYEDVFFVPVPHALLVETILAMASVRNRVALVDIFLEGKDL